MNRQEILKRLCYYDLRNPEGIVEHLSEDFGYDEEEIESYGNFPKKHCYCDYCHTGKSKLAEELLKLTDEFEQYKKESIKWGVNDFLSYEMGEGWSITEKQAQLALEKMIQHHDAAIGITWNTIEYYYKEYGTYKLK